MKIEMTDKNMYVYLEGEIDHHSAKGIRAEIDRKIEEEKPSVVILDFSAVTFMDSSGIGLVMGRYKIMKENNGQVTIANAPKSIKKVMQLSGVNKIAQIINTRMGE